MAIDRDSYKFMLAEKVRERMHANGFTRVEGVPSEIKALANALPHDCVLYDLIRMKSESVFVGGYYFKSPNPSVPIEKVLPIARLLRKDAKNTLQDAIKQVIALTDEDAITLLVADALVM